MNERDELDESWLGWLGGRTRRALHLPEYRPAAVLVGLTREPQTRVLLTRRSMRLPTHRGQISFPGGRLEAGETPAEAALREAWEEVGLPPAQVRVLGELDDVFTPAGFHVTPVLARVPAHVGFQLSGEVDEVLLPSLRELHSLTPLTEERTLPGGEVHVLYRYPWRGHDIWGMTARVLRDVLESGADERRF